MSNIYVIGSLRNDAIQAIGRRLREAGHDVFDDWHGAGPDADHYWQEYEQARGRTYKEALTAPIADHNFEFDLAWLEWADVGVLVMPAGKSGHLELGWLSGKGKRCIIYMPDGEPERWDLMYKFAEAVCYSVDEVIAALEHDGGPVPNHRGY